MKYKQFDNNGRVIEVDYNLKKAPNSEPNDSASEPNLAEDENQDPASENDLKSNKNLL